jgi:hypothetical protein
MIITGKYFFVYFPRTHSPLSKVGWEIASRTKNPRVIQVSTPMAKLLVFPCGKRLKMEKEDPKRGIRPLNIKSTNGITMPVTLTKLISSVGNLSNKTRIYNMLIDRKNRQREPKTLSFLKDHNCLKRKRHTTAINPVEI